MAQGRKTTPAAPAAPAVTINAAALADAGRALTALSEEALSIQQTFGLDSMEPATLEAEISVWMEHTARSMFMIGARLMALRTVTPHGEWLNRLARLGLAPRAAQKFITTAIKCVGQQGPRERLLQLGKSKVLELVALDDAALDELEESGRLSELALGWDEIDCMSVTELRARLRDSEASVAAKDKLIANKDKKLNQLAEALERPFAPSADSVAQTAEEQALLTQMRDCVTAGEAALLQLAALVARTQDGTMSPAMAGAGSANVEYLAQRVADIVEQAGVEVDFAEMVTPTWLQAAKAKTKPARRAS